MQPPDPAPVPISGVFAPGPGELILTFDLPLESGSFTESNWTIRAAGNRWTCDGVVVFAPAPLDVEGSFSPTIPAGGGPWVSYTAAVPDLIGQNGVPVEAFAEFPVTLI